MNLSDPIDFLKFYAILMTAVVFTILAVSVVHGEDFKYNLTQNMQQESKLLDLCINAPDMKIPLCHNIYGGLNTIYGDKIK